MYVHSLWAVLLVPGVALLDVLEGLRDQPHLLARSQVAPGLLSAHGVPDNEKVNLANYWVKTQFDLKGTGHKGHFVPLKKLYAIF